MEEYPSSIMGMAGKPLKVVRTMSNFFENLKNDAEKGWDDLKDSVERVDDAYRENFENNTSDWHNLYSWADGDLIDLPVFSDNPSAKDKTMQTLAYMMMKDNELVSPADGTVTGIDEDNNTIAINLSDKLTVAVKVCVSAVSLKSPEEARILVQEGEAVKKGQPLVKFARTLEAKTKMLLTATGTLEQFRALEEKSAREAGAVKKGDLLITKA